MATTYKTRAELRANPPQWTDEERRRLGATTEEEIRRQAEEDGAVATPEMLERAVLGREVRKIRERAGMNQEEFAEHYRLTVSRLRDWEQGRYAPDPAMLVYLRLIRDEPRAVARQLKAHVA
jgi:putative transcriptional regulator